jgi:DNA-directed RNA polymerase specialized sigma subunit
MKENINELIYLYRAGHEQVLEELIIQLRPMTVGILTECLGHYLQAPENREDEYLKADMLLVECLNRFRPHEAIGFKAYYRRSLRNQAVSTIRELGRKSPASILPLDACVKESDGTQHYIDVIASSQDVHNQALNRILLGELLEEAPDFLTEIELKILYMRLAQYRVAEIKAHLQVTERKIRYTSQKVRAWIQSH